MHTFHSIQQQLHIVDSDSEGDTHEAELASLSKAVELLQVVQSGLQAALTATRCVAAIEDMRTKKASCLQVPLAQDGSLVVAVPALSAASAQALLHLYPPFSGLAAERKQLIQEGFALLRTASATSSAATSPAQSSSSNAGAGSADSFELLKARAGPIQAEPDLARLAVRVLVRCAVASSTERTHPVAVRPPPQPADTGAGAEPQRSLLRQRLRTALLVQPSRQALAPSYALEHMQLIRGVPPRGRHDLLHEELLDADAVDEDMVNMSSALKQATQAMTDRLQADNAVLDSATAAAGTNLSSISATQAELSSENQGATVTFISTLVLLGVVACVFVATYAAIRFLPK